MDLVGTFQTVHHLFLVEAKRLLYKQRTLSDASNLRRDWHSRVRPFVL